MKLIEHALGKIAADTNHTLDSRRLFHGRGRCWSGYEDLSIDLFSPAIVITLFSERDPIWCEALTEAIVPRLESLGANCIYLQKRFQQPARYECVWGDEVQDTLYAQRGALKFHLGLHKQNIGFFLDIEPARLWLENVVRAKRVLNLFSYTCSFSVVAMAAGASSVVNVDMSSASLNVGRENHRLNNLGGSAVKYLAHDIFKSWSKIRKLGPYDIIVVDPPSFQKGSFTDDRDYPKVLRKLNELCTEQGEVLLCHNSPKKNIDDFREIIEANLVGFDFVKRLEPSLDFPDEDENRALKMLVYKKQ